jgi:hypothetical protein
MGIFKNTIRLFSVPGVIFLFINCVMGYLSFQKVTELVNFAKSLGTKASG